MAGQRTGAMPTVPRRPGPAPARSVLARSAAARAAMVLVALAVLWLAVAWAVAVP